MSCRMEKPVVMVTAEEEIPDEFLSQLVIRRWLFCKSCLVTDVEEALCNFRRLKNMHLHSDSHANV